MDEQLSIDRSKTAIVSMDWQMRQVGSFPEAFQKELLERANKVLAKVRQEGILVINVEVVRGERTPENTIHPAMTPPPGETLLTKHSGGAFATTNLNEILKEKGIETLVLMGIRTSIAILTTSRWATDLGYKLIYLSDCCADPDEEAHQFLMEKIFSGRGPVQQSRVVTAQEFLQALGEA